MSNDPGRPSWMDGSPRTVPTTVGSRQQSQSYIKSELPGGTWPARDDHMATPGGFPRSVVTGVKIIAALMLLNTCIGIAFVVISMIPPSGDMVTIDDYMSLWRLAASLVLGVISSIVVWKVVDAP